jgi:hypothetical protein
MNFHAVLWSRGYGSLQKWIQIQSRWGTVSVRASEFQVLNPASVPGTGHQGTRSINITQTPESPCPDLFPKTPVLTVKSPHCVFHTVIHGNVFCSFSDIALLVIITENEDSAFHWCIVFSCISIVFVAIKSNPIQSIPIGFLGSHNVVITY